ncbi:MAG: type 1 glutamine amidotransferase [Acidimicrobiales bacterium]
MAESVLRIVLVHPELLGTYGDNGNALVVSQRAAWRGVTAETLVAGAGQPFPESGDIYLIGGGEDAAQSIACEDLRDGGGLARAVDRGAVVFAVCAGFQVLGQSFPGMGGQIEDGLGLLGCATRRGDPPRKVGEIVIQPPTELGLPLLTGYENHAGVTELGEGDQPLGQVIAGHGNNGTVDGAWKERVIATYLHGPVLARNPALADLLLSWVVGDLEAIDDELVDALRAERLAAATPRGRKPRPGRMLRRRSARQR